MTHTRNTQFDPTLPILEVLVGGQPLFRTQTPGEAYTALRSLKHGRKAATLVTHPGSTRSVERTEDLQAMVRESRRLVQKGH